MTDVTTQPSDWAVATLREIAGGTTILTRYQCQQMHKAIDILARELDASGGGFTDEQVQRAWDAFCEVAHAKTGDDWGEADPIPAMRAALLTATPRAAEPATTNSAQISSSLVVGEAVKVLPAKWRGEQITVPEPPHGSSAKSYNCALRACADELEAAMGAVGAGESS